jgi:hypothetical protein
LDEVITFAAKVPVGGTSVWVFKVFEHPKMPRIMPEWSSLDAYYPTDCKVLGIPKTIEDGWDESFSPVDSGYYVKLSAPDQLKLIGSDLFDPTTSASEPRDIQTQETYEGMLIR